MLTSRAEPRANPTCPEGILRNGPLSWEAEKAGSARSCGGESDEDRSARGVPFREERTATIGPPHNHHGWSTGIEPSRCWRRCSIRRFIFLNGQVSTFVQPSGPQLLPGAGGPELAGSAEQPHKPAAPASATNKVSDQSLRIALPVPGGSKTSREGQTIPGLARGRQERNAAAPRLR